jgi:ribosome-associated protein
LSVEGAAASQWILMDFGDVVAHIFRSDVRAHYGLENLWGDARRVKLPPGLASPAPRPAAPAKPRVRRARKQG